MRSTTVTSTLTRRSARAAARPPNPPPTITIRRRPKRSPDTGGLHSVRRRTEALQQVVADAQRVRHRGQGRIDRADAGEATRVDDVEVVDLVRAAVRVEHGRRAVAPEAAGPRVVRDARHGDVVLAVRVAREQVVLMQPELSQQRLELLPEALL